MKAYVYRSGHVFIGPSTPDGAEELAEHHDEAELLLVLRRHTAMMNDSEGCPQMVIPALVNKTDEFYADIEMRDARGKISRAVTRIMQDPACRAEFTVGPIVPWVVGPTSEYQA